MDHDTLDRATKKDDYRSFSRAEIRALQDVLGEFRAAVAAFRSTVVGAPVGGSDEAWERWYRRVMTVMDASAHLVTAEDHGRVDDWLRAQEENNE